MFKNYRYSPLNSPTPVSHWSRNRRWLLISLVAASLFFFYLAITQFDRETNWRNFENVSQDGNDSARNGNGDSKASAPTDEPPPFRHKHVAFATDFGAHFDVYMAFVKTVHDVLSQDSESYPDWSIQVFDGVPFGHGFSDVVDRIDLYQGPYRPTNELVDVMRYDGVHGLEEENKAGKIVDLLIFGTCEIDMIRWSDDLLAIYDARPADKKFELVCIVHNVHDVRWQSNIREWARRGAIRLLPIASHVGYAFRQKFKELADNPSPEAFTAMYEFIPIDVHAPVLDLPDLVPLHSDSHPTDTELSPEIDSGGNLSNLADSGVPYPPTRSATLSRAVIQGNFETARRDYENIFRDLLELMIADPEAWGYQPLSSTQPSFLPIKHLTEDDPEPFTLTLIGQGELKIPTELEHVVVIRHGLPYWDFYRVMMSMSIVVPAFGNPDYYDVQASSTIAMSVQCNAPILATTRIRNAYGYIDDDRVTITRPQALREMEAIYILRKRNFNFSEYSSRHNITSSVRELPQLETSVDKMLRQGWRRAPVIYNQFKQELWQKNRDAARRVIEGRRGLGAGIKDF